MYFIYQIKNKENGQVYIGKSTDVERRLKKHSMLLRLNKHNSTNLQKDFNVFGIDSFECKVIYENVPESEVNDLEKNLMIANNSHKKRHGYNSQDPYFLESITFNTYHEISEEEFEELMNNIKNERDKKIVILMYKHGLNAEEIYSLDKSSYCKYFPNEKSVEVPIFRSFSNRNTSNPLSAGSINRIGNKYLREYKIKRKKVPEIIFLDDAPEKWHEGLIND